MKLHVYVHGVASALIAPTGAEGVPIASVVR